jgi:hypothetical protein
VSLQYKFFTILIKIIVKYRKFEKHLANGQCCEKDYAIHMEPLIGFTKMANTDTFRNSVIKRFGVSLIRGITGCSGAVAGTTTLRTAARPTATGTRPATGTTISGSGWLPL